MDPAGNSIVIFNLSFGSFSFSHTRSNVLGPLTVPINSVEASLVAATATGLSFAPVTVIVKVLVTESPKLSSSTFQLATTSLVLPSAID